MEPSTYSVIEVAGPPFIAHSVRGPGMVPPTPLTRRDHALLRSKVRSFPEASDAEIGDSSLQVERPRDASPQTGR